MISALAYYYFVSRGLLPLPTVDKCAMQSLKRICSNKIIGQFEIFEKYLDDLPDIIKHDIFLNIHLVSIKHPKIVHIFDKLITSYLTKIDLTNVHVNNALFKTLKPCHLLQKLLIQCERDSDCGVSAEVLQEILPGFKYLQVFHFSNARSLNDEVIQTLTTSCVYLTGIDISSAGLITNESMDHISKLQYLTGLNIAYTRVTIDGIETLAKGKCGPVLKELDVTSCKNLIVETLPLICNHFVSLEVFSYYNTPMSSSNNSCLENLKNLKHVTWTL